MKTWVWSCKVFRPSIYLKVIYTLMVAAMDQKKELVDAQQSL